MSLNSLIPSLIFMTLCAGLGFALVQYLSSLQRRSNRVAASNALLGENTPSSDKIPDGALPELVSLVAVAAVVMALLGFGYHWSDRANASAMTNASGTVAPGKMTAPVSPDTQMSNPSKPTATPADNPGVPTSRTSPSTGG